MKKIEDVLKNTTEENQDKVNWTKAWSGKYPVLRQYQNEVDIPKYATEIRKMFNQLQNDYGYSEQDKSLIYISLSLNKIYLARICIKHVLAIFVL